MQSKSKRGLYTNVDRSSELEHQCRQEIALVLKGGREIIGKFVYLFLFIFHFSICY